MGSQRIVWMMFYVLLSPLVRGMDSYNPDSLDSFIHDYANKAIKKPRTGILYNISLPANFSGMEVSIVRLRSGSFWTRGANFSYFHIPPRIIPMPFVKRLAIVYENLGNWSSYYYNVPNYTFVTPVVGFGTYGASTKGSAILKLSIMGDPILVHFPRIPENVTLKCVRFGTDGSVEFSNMTTPSVCIARDQGHFSIVVPSPAKKKKKKERFWKWWVIGFGVGVVGLVLVALVGVLIYKLVRRKRIGKMEKQSERSEALETMWVGMSKMPSATGIRTQPMLENDYIP
uniref:Non-specific serine/threonine protein kinase n=1 Tax=Davidia involucrata TaxID=16924 RepID=A0A5B7CC26_DAVIN